MTTPGEFDEVDETQLTHNPTIHVAEFEGGYVTQMRGKIPAITIPMGDGYRRGTHIRLQVEVRVRNVRYEELKNGELLRDHILQAVSVRSVVAIAPEDLAAEDVSGSASAHPTPGPEATEELGVQFRRTSDTWGGDSVAGF